MYAKPLERKLKKCIQNGQSNELIYMGRKSPTISNLNTIYIYRDLPRQQNLFLCCLFSNLPHCKWKLCLLISLYNCVISCCSIGAFLDLVVYPTCITSVLEIGNEQCSNPQCIRTGKISSCAGTPLLSNCWIFPPTFPCSHLPSWIAATCAQLF